MSISERIRMFFSSISSRPVNKPAPKQYSPQRMSMHTPLRMQSQLANSKLGHKKDCIIAIASSTGGPEALDKILRMLPEDLPPILIAQHMPSTFTKQFAQRLNNYSALTVKEAEDSEPIYPGHVYIAPGDFHMVVKKRGNELFLNCITGSKVNGVRPAADVLFESIANIMPSKSIGVILTGMGADGAKGLCMMKNVGSYNIGQDETSCVIYGMPRVAYNLGCLDVQLPLDKIPDRIVSIVNKIF